MEMIVMSQKECQRLKVIESFARGYVTRGEAALELALSKRQITRIRKRYEELSNTGILRKKSISKPPRSYDGPYIDKILDLVKTHYHDFGPTLAAEKLHEVHNILIAKETLRRWMIRAGLHKEHQRAVKKIHPLRERRPCLGELIQIDGSHHAWFEGRAPICCLLVFIDDATGQLLHLQFTPSESHESYAQAFYDYLHKHGKPLAIYTDKHSVFSVNRKEISVEADGVTALGKSLHELEIESRPFTSSQRTCRTC
jgi:Helix-turn-helix domain